MQLSGLTIAEINGGVRLSCAVEGRDLPAELWFSLQGVGPAEVAADLYNWAAVALLYPAMLRGEDLTVSGAVSRRLFTNVNRDLQAVLCAYDPRLSRIQLKSDRLADRLPARAAVRAATGFSAGVDSFATLALYSSDARDSGIRVTDLCTFNVGAMGRPDASGVAELFERACERTSRFASANGLGAVSIDTNLSEFYPREGFQRTHTLRNAAAALALEGGLEHYLYSSGVPLSSVAVAQGKDTAPLDPILLPLLSTENLTFMSGGAGLSRAQKTARVAAYAPAFGALDVCVEPAAERIKRSRPNCSACWKCRRTIITLDALGALDRFDSVFDLDEYRRNRGRMLGELAVSALGGNGIDREVLDLLGQDRPPLGPTVVWRLFVKRLTGNLKRLRKRLRFRIAKKAGGEAQRRQPRPPSATPAPRMRSPTDAPPIVQTATMRS